MIVEALSRLVAPGDVVALGGAGVTANPMRLAQALAHGGTRGLTVVSPHPGPATALLIAHGVVERVVVLDGEDASPWIGGVASEVRSGAAMEAGLEDDVHPTLTILNVPTAELTGWIAPHDMWDVRLCESARHVIATTQREDRTAKSLAADVLLSAKGCWPTAPAAAGEPDRRALDAYEELGRVEMLEAPF